jgi:hypothetical protein
MARPGTWAGRAAALVGVAAAVLLLAGCPYGSDQPLADPALAVPDQALIGTWQAQDPETGETLSFTFVPFNGHEMVGFSREIGSDDTAISVFRIFITRVGQQGFLNVQELRGDSDQPQWYFARYRFAGDALMVRLVDDTLFGSKSFATPQALQSFVLANLEDPRLYGEPDDATQEMVLTRPPK